MQLQPLPPSPATGFITLQIISWFSALATLYFCVKLSRIDKEFRPYSWPIIAVLLDILAFYFFVITDYYYNYLTVDFSYWSSLLRFHTIVTALILMGVRYYVAKQDQKG